MPQSQEVEEFLRAVGPFYDAVSEGDKEKAESSETNKLEDTDSDSEEEFHDSMAESQHPLPIEVSIPSLHSFISDIDIMTHPIATPTTH